MQTIVKNNSTRVRTPICSPRPVAGLRGGLGPGLPGHSREGGNLWGVCRRVERLNFAERFLADAKWIPAYAGMTGWGLAPGGLPGGQGQPSGKRLLAMQRKNVGWIKRSGSTILQRWWIRRFAP